jgi:hypothetical protein
MHAFLLKSQNVLFLKTMQQFAAARQRKSAQFWWLSTWPVLVGCFGLGSCGCLIAKILGAISGCHGRTSKDDVVDARRLEDFAVLESEVLDRNPLLRGCCI